jgi:uncharacterized membrane protein YqjE
MITHNTKSNGMRTSTNNLPTSNSHRPVDFAGNLSDVAHDITQLVELQGQLFVVDIKEAQEKLKTPIILAATGGLLSLCAMPLLLVAIAQGLILAGLQSWAAYAIVSVVGLAIGGLLLWQSWRSMKDSALVLDRSRAELAQNVAWLKQMLKCRSEAARMDANCRT